MSINTETQQFLNEYYFDEVYHADNNMSADLAKNILTMHGAGGKFVEQIIQSRFMIDDVDGIHDFDGQTAAKRMVEMKMETINSVKLNAMGSWGSQRESTEVWKGDVYRETRPYIMNIGTCSDSGKCIYVMCLDTAKLARDSKVFLELDKPAPRMNFSHFREDRDAYRLLYINRGLYGHWKHRFNKYFATELDRMSIETSVKSLDALMA